ncbi:MAG TPA: isoleucine--tRNA ligase [Bacteroidia bacterium]|nr:isoleucine--tRNA ligase [Bacteroidia bacterium]
MGAKKYPEFKQFDLPSIAKEILAKWEAEKTFEKSVEIREGKTPFTFYEGPPSANGLPGIHHVMSRTIKDLFCRYKTLQGYQVKRKGGWDTHGLPIEISVEKTLGITKEDIGKKISVEEYNKECRKEVMKYKNVWDDLTRKMGYWVDLEHPYITFENSYIETVWYLLKMFYEKGLLYKGYTIQPYSPAAGTGLSSHELNQPGTYRPIKDTTIVAQFRMLPERDKVLPIGEDLGGAYFLAWTTTPWTLPGNCALAVGEKIKYVFVQTFNPYTFEPLTVILAKDLSGKFFPEKNAELKLEDYKSGDKAIPFKVIGEVTGKDLKGIKYEQLMPYVQPNGKAFEVILGDFVSTEDGTGIVHTASLFGADDFRVCNENNIASVMVKDENGNPSPLVDKRGRFVKEVTDFAREYVRTEYLTEAEKEAERKKQGGEKYLSVDERIAIKLKKENKAFKVEKYEHSYPHCWRTDKPILYYPLDSWFIKTTACKERLIELNNTINWKPASTGTGRFGNWLENLVDWNLSRSRFWGIPLPIWRTEDKKEEICIGSIEELKKEIEKSIAAGFMDKSHLEHVDASKTDFDLHRPYVDNIILVSVTGKKMFRELDLIDVWFDSGAMPYAQWGLDYDKMRGGNSLPFGEGWGGAFPADFIAEGVDQTRGWFFTLHVIAVMLFDSVAFKNVMSNGLVLDKAGNKMSKRLGNTVDPFETISKYGPDATRWYLISNAQPWDNLKFNEEGIADEQRKLFGTLYNTYSFFALYANIDNFFINEQDIVPVKERAELDRWIISKLHSLVKDVTGYYDDYEPTKAARVIEEFVDAHLSNWYVRLSRRRFWRSEMSKDKKAAYETLFECLMVTAQLMSPVAPFFSDWLYRNLSDEVRDFAKKNNTPLAQDSVHLSLMTKAEEDVIDKSLEERMDLAQKISSMVLSLRKKVNIRVRQPLNRILLPIPDNSFKKNVEAIKHLILAEVNVKQVEYISDTSGLLVKKIKPNFKVLGKKVGAMMKDVAAAIPGLSNDDIAKFEREGNFELQLKNQKINLVAEDVEILSEDIPGWQVTSDGNITVALDTSITEQLREEGIARELVNRIQNIRKDKGFEVTDKIQISIKAHDSINAAISNNFTYICTEILAASLKVVENLEDEDSIAIEVDDNIRTLTSIKKST